MNNYATSFAGYWRNSLADAELGRGAWRKKDIGAFDQCKEPELLEGKLNPGLVQRFFSDEEEDVQEVMLAIRPLVMQLEFEHGSSRESSMPAVITPIIAKCILDREGRLFPVASQIFIARDLLEPLDYGTYAIGQVADLDTFLTNNAACSEVIDRTDEVHRIAIWGMFLDYARTMLGAVSPALLEEGSPYVPMESWCVSKVGGIDSPARKIIALYDYLRRGKAESPLFEMIARRLPMVDEPLIIAPTQFEHHLGHSSDKHALAQAQRDAVIHTLCAKHGDVVGVNGPPGTGKTTMLLTMVASLWVKAALEKGDPPVIVASSTNNQAVTNIIDAFGKDFADGEGVFSGRWIPGVRSFGVFLASQAKRKDAAEKYQTQDFFETVENKAFIFRSRDEYVAKARTAFPSDGLTTVESIVERLHAEMIKERQKLLQAKMSLDQYSEAKKICASHLGSDFGGGLDQKEKDLVIAQRNEARAQKLDEHIDSFLASEPLWVSFLLFIPPVRMRQVAQAIQSLRSVDPKFKLPETVGSIAELRGYLQGRVSYHRNRAENLKKAIAQAKAILGEYETAKNAWEAIASALGNPNAQCLDDLNDVADIGVRFKLFKLATHYWEGRWLIEAEAMSAAPENFNKKGVIHRKSAWRRRMMLTPCAVSTFYTLPGEMQYVRHDGGFIEEYLVDFIDLLIVDEAGQVLPEVAGASFALAKKALVIGDTLQIEPIWSIPPSVDAGNLVANGLIEAGDQGDEALERLQASGRTASRGSVMAIAQFVSRYRYDKDIGKRGLFLYEHRRCYDEIIDYCNRLCYHGKLIPRRGSAPEGGLPCMAYIHTEGECKKSHRGGRVNELEAETVVQWIFEFQETLRAQYPGKEIHEIVGVVTPFASQVVAIRECARDYGLPVLGEGAITIGTVHSLQGAERPIVLFSHVYTSHPGADGGFIDTSPSMLNVAVSRAKDSFIVFADMKLLLVCAPGTPRGVLASILQHEKCRIEYAPSGVKNG